MTDTKSTWGGKREGAGRPKGWRKGFSQQRRQRQVRAFDDEWVLIKKFATLVKKNRTEAERALTDAERRGGNKMKAIVKFYEKGFAGSEVPEITELREKIEADGKKQLVEKAKEIALPASAEYAHIYIDDNPVIAICDDGSIRDIENDEWIIEPEDEEA